MRPKGLRLKSEPRAQPVFGPKFGCKVSHFTVQYGGECALVREAVTHCVFLIFVSSFLEYLFAELLNNSLVFVRSASSPIVCIVD